MNPPSTQAKPPFATEWLRGQVDIGEAGRRLLTWPQLKVKPANENHSPTLLRFDSTRWEGSNACFATFAAGDSSVAKSLRARPGARVCDGGCATAAHDQVSMAVHGMRNTTVSTHVKLELLSDLIV